MIVKLGLFSKELFLFGATLLVGLFSAYRLAPLAEKSFVQASFSFYNAIFFLMFFIILIALMKSFKRFNLIAFKFFLLLVVFSGSQVILGSFIPLPWDILLAMVFVAIFMLIHNVLVHDLGIMLGIAGISSVLGITVSPMIGLALLVILSFYDILAVYWTKHMVYMARDMIESGAILGFVIPFEIKDFFYHKSEAGQKLGEKFMILGSGDIGLPIVFLSSIIVISVRQAFITSIFVFGGLFLTHLIFVNQKERKPMAALPPIATMTIIGYIVSQLL